MSLIDRVRKLSETPPSPHAMRDLMDRLAEEQARRAAEWEAIVAPYREKAIEVAVRLLEAERRAR